MTHLFDFFGSLKRCNALTINVIKERTVAVADVMHCGRTRILGGILGADFSALPSQGYSASLGKLR